MSFLLILMKNYPTDRYLFNKRISYCTILQLKMEKEVTILDPEKIADNLSTQLDEIEMLHSIFCNPGEIKVPDPNTLEAIKKYIEGNRTSPPPYIDTTINLLIENDKFELYISLSHEYPQMVPDIYVRNPKLNRIQHKTLNEDLKKYIASLTRDEPCLFSGITWIQDNLQSYITAQQEVSVEEKSEELVRYWIYSHHIYSKFKRKEILNLANALKLTGFCLPGKPGIICVEGNISDCNEWWLTIKSMTWKRIFCKLTEECNDKENFLKFKDFQEIAFQINGNRCNHMDMGELNKFLKEHQCAYIFKELFGVDGKSNEEII